MYSCIITSCIVVVPILFFSFSFQCLSLQSCFTILCVTVLQLLCRVLLVVIHLFILCNGFILARVAVINTRMFLFLRVAKQDFYCEYAYFRFLSRNAQYSWSPPLLPKTARCIGSAWRSYKPHYCVNVMSMATLFCNREMMTQVSPRCSRVTFCFYMHLVRKGKLALIRLLISSRRNDKKKKKTYFASSSDYSNAQSSRNGLLVTDVFLVSAICTRRPPAQARDERTRRTICNYCSQQTEKSRRARDLKFMYEGAVALVHLKQELIMNHFNTVLPPSGAIHFKCTKRIEVELGFFLQQAQQMSRLHSTCFV